jgi:hypothetical protein
VGFDDPRLMEERNKRLVGRFDQQELEWISVESYALEGTQDGVQNSASGDWIDCENMETSEKSITNALFPMPPIDLSEKTPFSWKSTSP